MNGADNNVALFRLRIGALVVGIIALAIGIFMAVTGHSEQFFRSYLIGWVLVAGCSIGAIGLLMMQYLTGGIWGILIRRPLEAASKLIWLVALGFIPVVLGAQHIYEWARPEAVAHSELLQHKAGYLSMTPFVTRGIIYFVAWGLFAFLLTSWDRKFEATADRRFSGRMAALSAFGLVFMGFSATFASIDWLMSLEPEWYSTMYGISFIVGDLLTAMAFCILVLVSYSAVSPVSEAVKPTYFRDLGNLMFAFVILWAYTAFSEFLLIWYGNIREEVTYHLRRMHGGWGMVSIALLVLHFFLPFFLLLMRAIKDRPWRLAGVAAFILVMRVVDYIWKVIPAFGAEGEHTHSVMNWMDLLMIVGVAAVWLFFFITLLKREPLLPMYERHVQESLAGNSGHEALQHG